MLRQIRYGTSTVPELDPIPPRNSWKADVRIEAAIVTKSFERNSAVPRWMGRWFLNREQRALQRLDGLDGVPRFISRPGPYQLCMTRVDGIPLRNCYERGISEAFFADLVRLFDSMHRRGVGHGDAHHRNILVAGDRAGLIDFSVAHVTRDPERRSGRVFQWYLALDQRALYKVENGFLHRGTPPEMFMLYRLAKRFQSHH